MTGIAIGALDEQGIAAAGRTLSAAFQGDPLQAYFLPDPAERAALSPVMLEAFVRQASLFGEIAAADDLAGIAAFLPPGAEMNYEKAERSGFTRLPEIVGKAAFERFGRVLDYLSDAHQGDLPAEHWYLTIIGVLPEARGRGTGSALIAPIIERAEAAGMPICLDTAQPRVRPLYERLGFRVTCESVDPTSGVRFWSYRRG